MMNLVVSGNLGDNAELKVTQAGESVLSFSVASNDKRGGGKEACTWVRCSLWGKRGEALAQYLRKGTRVCVVGTPRLREYESQGERKTSLDVRVDQLDLLGGGERAEPTPHAAAPAPRAAAPPKRDFGDTYDPDLPF